MIKGCIVPYIPDEPISSKVRIGSYEYNTVTIGNQVWITEHLKENLTNSIWPDENYADLYSEAGIGKLYQPRTIFKNEDMEYTDEFKSILPEGWEIPTRADFLELFNYADNDTLGNDRTDALYPTLCGTKLLSENYKCATDAESTNDKVCWIKAYNREGIKGTDVYGFNLMWNCGDYMASNYMQRKVVLYTSENITSRPPEYIWPLVFRAEPNGIYESYFKFEDMVGESTYLVEDCYAGIRLFKKI